MTDQGVPRACLALVCLVFELAMLVFLRHLRALVIKEFQAILKDPRSRRSVLLPPIIQTIVFGYAATFDLKNVPWAVLDRDHSAASRALIASFTGSGHFDRVATLANTDQIRPMIDDQRALLVLQIGPHFQRDLTQGHPSAVQVIVDGRNSNTASIALGYASQVVQGFSERYAKLHNLPPPASVVVDRAWFNENFESQWFFVPGIIGVITLLIGLLTSAMSVAREREQGTFDQLLVTPMRPVEILIGKAMPGLLIGLAEAGLIILLAIFWFEVPLRGSLAALFAGECLFVLAAVGVGLMISSLATTMQQGLLGTFIVVMPATILSGLATPIQNMAAPVQWLTYANPLRYILIILRAVFLEGASASSLWPQLWPMAVIAAVTLSLAAFLFRHRMY